MKLTKLIVPTVILNNEKTKHTLSKGARYLEKRAAKINPQFARQLKNMNEAVENIHNSINNVSDANTPDLSKFFAPTPTDFTLGDHLYVQRKGYTHHGIYIGNNKIIHYKREIGITFDTLEAFALNAKIHIKNSPKTYSNAEIIVRARSRVGENNYNVFKNNCEHFARWCRSGRIS